MDLIQELEQEQISKLSAGKEIPDFGPGDTVLVNVKVVRRGKVRRAKLYYLRQRRGKSARITERQDRPGAAAAARAEPKKAAAE